jgi:phage regulator Rha-like protein
MDLKLEMTSREIAELVDKEHFHVIRDIERMFEQLAESKIGLSDFLDIYQDVTWRTLKMYRLDKDLTMTLVTKYDTARRYAVVRRWRELEEQAQGGRREDL